LPKYVEMMKVREKETAKLIRDLSEKTNNFEKKNLF